MRFSIPLQRNHVGYSTVGNVGTWSDRLTDSQCVSYSVQFRRLGVDADLNPTVDASDNSLVCKQAALDIYRMMVLTIMEYTPVFVVGNTAATVLCSGSRSRSSRQPTTSQEERARWRSRKAGRLDWCWAVPHTRGYVLQEMLGNWQERCYHEADSDRQPLQQVQPQQKLAEPTRCCQRTSRCSTGGDVACVCPGAEQ